MVDEQDKEYTSNTIGKAERTGSKFPRKGESCSSPFTALPLFGMQGYIKTYRKSLDSSVWWKSPIVWQVWSWCLLKAHFAERDLPTSEGDITLEPGQFVSWRKKAVAELPISERQLRTAFKYLKATSRVSIKTTNKYSIFTVLNWYKYQQSDQQPVTQMTSKRPANDPIYKKDKKVKNNIDIKLFPHLNNESFLKEWNTYVEHRREIRRPISSQTQERTLKTLHKYPIDEATKMLSQSIDNGWQGVFPLKSKKEDTGKMNPL